MSINLDQAQQTFIVEARELLQAMEQSLLQLDSEPGDQDAIGFIDIDTQQRMTPLRQELDAPTLVTERFDYWGQQGLQLF